jgi:hypothetical protein
MTDYTIKSWMDETLYIAKGAADVRAAVEAAVRSGADLSGAYLSGADLSGASLSGADLSRASLSGADLSGADLSGADLSRANLSRANLSRANLSRVNLSRANLSRANLSRVNLSGATLSRATLSRATLSGADLSGADLSRADLSRANLSRAYGLVPERVNPLLMLLDQPGAIRAYKLVDAEYRSPIQSTGKLTYKLGDTIEVTDANTDPAIDCAAGVNIATLPWVIREWKPGYHILVVEFTAADIAAIPIGDGKFRVRRCTVVGEKDLVALGLVEAKPKRVRKPKVAA